MNKYRTHNCSELNEKDIDKKVYISGWLHRKRDHGNLLFIDLRDHYGITQCVIENNSEYFTILEKTKPESVLKVTGKVVKREKNTQNLDIKTGKIEISIEKVEILSNAKELPIPVFVSKSEVFNILPDVASTNFAVIVYRLPNLPTLPRIICFAPSILPTSIKHSSTQPLICSFCSFNISSILLLSTTSYLPIFTNSLSNLVDSCLTS